MEKTRTTIYVSPELWERFKKLATRDSMKMSNIVEDLVRGWVDMKEPGNPQRPLTAFVTGHDDEVAARRSTTIKELIKDAEKRGGELNYAHVVQAIRAASSPAGYRIPVLARSMCQALEKLGVRILWPARGAF